jgi:hypothetical protein
MSDRGKIRARRVSGNCSQHQRDVAVAIKTARELALLPYTQRSISERAPGRGRGPREGGGGGGRGGYSPPPAPVEEDVSAEPEADVDAGVDSEAEAIVSGAEEAV